MSSFPGIVLGTWVLNNLTYPFFFCQRIFFTGPAESVVLLDFIAF